MDKYKDSKTKWRMENREYMREHSKKYGPTWRAKNKDKIRKYNAEYRAKNKEKIKVSEAERRAKNKERRKEIYDKWRKENPEKVRMLRRIESHNRRARIRLNGGVLSVDIVDKLLNLQRGKCAICKVNLKKTGNHLDHIVPIALGGKNVDSNTQLTCPTCNKKKCAKDPIRFMQEMGYLL